MAETIIRSRDVGDYQKLLQEMNMSPRLAKILSSRGITSKEDIDYGLKHLELPTGMPDINRAAERIVRAIENDEHILICGDYDADGATSSALCILFFRSIGFENAGFRVPDRFKLGYGLTAQLVESLLEESPDLLITVDNGVASVDGVNLANENGIDVIVTDHHLPSEDESQIPSAYAIVNPHMKGSEFSSPACGVGVAFYLLSVVRRQLINTGYFENHYTDPPQMTQWLDLVALGTVVDMVPLDLNNRRLVSEGLNRMRHGLMRPGLKSLCEVSRTDYETMTTQDLGFRLGPRINAAGRLDDISKGIQLLICDDTDQAFEYAAILDEINNRRRRKQKEMSDEAMRMVESIKHIDRHSHCLYHDDFHEGIVGLVATQIVRETNRPAIVFAKADSSSDEVLELKGSARSIDSVHIRDMLALMETQYPKLIRRFGGHAAAAGLTIAAASFERFRTLFNRLLEEAVPASAFEDVQMTDGELEEDEFTLELADEINQFDPWGQKFPRPQFHGTFEVISHRSVGREKEHQKYTLKTGPRMIEAIAFNSPPVDEGNFVQVTYDLTRNDFEGQSTPQLNVNTIEVVSPHSQ